MRFIDFFAGIGGLRRGMELAGHECVGFCEYDRFATASYVSMHLLTDKQREYLKTLPLKQRQKEVLEDEYRNGEWYADDIRRVDAGSLPGADCWCYGSPCTSFSLAGKRAGMEGASGLVREIFRLLDELPEEGRPEWLVYENVKGMLSSNRGWDYAAILAEMDRLGYDAEWQNINSSWFVPQNRERIYTIGHLRRSGSRKILPVGGPGQKDQVPAGIKIIGEVNASQDGKIHDLRGIAKCHSAGHNNSPKIAVPVCLSEDGIRASKVKDGSGRTGEADNHPAAVPLGIIDPQGRRSKEVSLKDTCPTLRSETHGNLPMACLGIAEKPGREDGIYVEMPGGFLAYAIWYEKEHCYMAVRRLTPKETFRLQGWTDDYFEKAAFVNTDSQLYKQSGNGVTVDVAKAVGDRIAEAERKHTTFRN